MAIGAFWSFNGNKIRSDVQYGLHRLLLAHVKGGSEQILLFVGENYLLGPEALVVVTSFALVDFLGIFSENGFVDDSFRRLLWRAINLAYERSVLVVDDRNWSRTVRRSQLTLNNLRIKVLACEGRIVVHINRGFRSFSGKCCSYNCSKFLHNRIYWWLWIKLIIYTQLF